MISSVLMKNTTIEALNLEGKELIKELSFKKKTKMNR